MTAISRAGLCGNHVSVREPNAQVISHNLAKCTLVGSLVAKEKAGAVKGDHGIPCNAKHP